MMQMPIVRLFCPRCNTELQNTVMEYRCHLCAWEASVQPVMFPQCAASPPATVLLRSYDTGGNTSSWYRCPIHGSYWGMPNRCPQADAHGACSR